MDITIIIELGKIALKHKQNEKISQRHEEILQKIEQLKHSQDTILHEIHALQKGFIRTGFNYIKKAINPYCSESDRIFYLQKAAEQLEIGLGIHQEKLQTNINHIHYLTEIQFYLAIVYIGLKKYHEASDYLYNSIQLLDECGINSQNESNEIKSKITSLPQNNSIFTLLSPLHIIFGDRNSLKFVQYYQNLNKVIASYYKNQNWRTLNEDMLNYIEENLTN